MTTIVGVKRQVTLGELRIDGGTQPREALDTAITAEYEAAYRRGDDMPPVIVFHDGATHWLADGFHRYFAARAAGLDAIPADVHTGTVLDAIVFACGANEGHGLRRCDGDRRKAILTIHGNPELAARYNTQALIAEVCRCSQQFVSAVLGDITTSSNISDPAPAPRTSVVKTKRGTTFTRDSSKAGRKAAPKPPPDPEPDMAPGDRAILAARLAKEKRAAAKAKPSSDPCPEAKWARVSQELVLKNRAYKSEVVGLTALEKRASEQLMECLVGHLDSVAMARTATQRAWSDFWQRKQYLFGDGMK